MRTNECLDDVYFMIPLFYGHRVALERHLPLKNMARWWFMVSQKCFAGVEEHRFQISFA